MVTGPITPASRVEAAGDHLRAVLHEPLYALSVPELDRVLVELVEVTRRIAELAERTNQALAERTTTDRLRLDYHGQQRFDNPKTAVGAARSALGTAGLAAGQSAAAMDAARQITAHIGLSFDDTDDPAGEDS